MQDAIDEWWRLRGGRAETGMDVDGCEVQGVYAVSIDSLQGQPLAGETFARAMTLRSNMLGHTSRTNCSCPLHYLICEIRIPMLN